MTPEAKIKYDNGFKLGLKIRKAAILSGLLLLGWHAHRTFVYAEGIYHKAEACDSISCENLADTEQRLAKLPVSVKKGG